MAYFHKDQNRKPLDFPLGKIVCVGRNYAKHAQELGNEIPKEPLLFIKPVTALADLEQDITIPNHRGEVHYETEIAVLIKNTLSSANLEQAENAIWGYGLAFDLTLRELQTELKKQGHPWEKAKAFDGAAPVSRFIDKSLFDHSKISFGCKINSKVVQYSSTKDMFWSISSLLSKISEHFTLQAGDIVLTGTPEGVGQLCENDHLSFTLSSEKIEKILYFKSQVASFS